MSMMILVPHTQLDPQTLNALIEEFVTRDGAVHGHADRSAGDRVDSVLRQLRAGMVAIVFDETEETCTIVRKENLPAELRI
jgi:uncharacterized protein YheU (UPF0270 family)